MNSSFTDGKDLSVVLPEIKKVAFDQGWNISFYEEYQSVFLDQTGQVKEAIKNQLRHYLQADYVDFRQQLDICGVAFLVGIFYSCKEIRIYTARLNDELFLLKELEKNEVELNKAKDRYLALKEYSEKVALLRPEKFPSVHQLITNQFALPDLLSDKKYLDVNPELDKEISGLISKVNLYRSSLFERLTDWGLSLTANFALFRIHVLKFLAILPSLDFDTKGTEVKRILIESFRRLLSDSARARSLNKKGQESPLTAFLTFLCSGAYYAAKILPAKPLSMLVRFSVRFMAKRFIAGETIELAHKSLLKLFKSNRDVTLDQLGELVVSEKEADHYCAEVLKLIRGFSLHIKNKGEKNKAGINRAHVSIKVSALCSDFKPHAPEYTYNLVAPRLRKILIAAKEESVFLNVDSEHYDYRDIVFDIYKRVLLDTPELKDFDQTGIVLQAYLRDAYRHFLDILELAKARGLCMPIRIVKGAYWDAETIHADAHSFDAPEFLNKEETDLNFRQIIIKILENYPHVQLVVASHNFADHSFAEVMRNKLFPNTPVIEHQCLDMTYEALSTGMAKMGWPVRNYVPVGSLLVGMAYLVRRIMENSSQVGVLTIMRSHKNFTKVSAPEQIHKEKCSKGMLLRDLTQQTLTDEFFNVAPVKTYLAWERRWVLESLEQFRQNKLGQTYANPFPHTAEMVDIVSSSDSSILVGKIQYGTKEDAEKIIETAYASYNRGIWAKACPLIRSSYLLKAANIMLARRNELTWLIAYEAGKPLIEALADVDEAIDFLRFYAREEIKVTRENPRLISRGVIGVISPWNFPIAIPCGMTVSSLAAGNSIILKSASQTSLVGQELINILHQAGVPQDVVIHLVGRGAIVGEALVENEKVAGMVFTGSKEVGMSIAHKMGKRIVENKVYGKKYPTKVITEMGGKNAIIVTANAELDETVAGILYSAFGHSGQKCSAASRVIVDKRVKDRLIERLREAVRDLKVGEAFDLATSVNPVITMRDKKRLQDAVKEACEEARVSGGQVIIDRSQENHPGYCVGPAVIEVPYSRATKPDSYAMNELFGPVVHIIAVDNMEQALEVFNATEYGLTGGIFSQSQDDIDSLSQKMECGNLYINRAITGARVAIEPFGGFKLSGTGPKAGGTDYLSAFHVNPALTVDSSLVDERGSDYQFYLCRPAKLSVEQRLERVTKALDILLANFESIFRKIAGDDKEVLLKYRAWINRNLISFQLGEHSNRKIPGQLSFNDYSLVQEYAVVLAFNERPAFVTFMQFISAMTMGPGVTVITRNQKAFEWWSSIKDILFQAGFDKNSIDVFFATAELLEKTLKEPYLSSIIIDGDIDRVERVLNNIYDQSCHEKRMRSILTPFDASQPGDFEKYLGHYSWVRAFAVNTMRHGAPLNIDL